MCIFVPAPLFLYQVHYLHQLSAVEYMSADIYKFRLYVVQLQHHNLKKASYSMLNLQFLVQIKCTSYFNIYVCPASTRQTHAVDCQSIIFKYMSPLLSLPLFCFTLRNSQRIKEGHHIVRNKSGLDSERYKDQNHKLSFIKLSEHALFRTVYRPSLFRYGKTNYLQTFL